MKEDPAGAVGNGGNAVGDRGVVIVGHGRLGPKLDRERAGGGWV